ncbi:hypothetical protein ACFV3I_17660 [Microbacterium sp. NPDC059771]|uniref:hypothetical protein n=1 Tax=unclassified Microbacterium TaxID=2609290 RepID=UPI00109BEBE2|nr:hypothetical protein [Microbacterium sp. PF5]
MDQSPTTKAQPSGARITGWIATLFCAGLAFLNAALATEIAFRIFFVACGVVLVVGVISMVIRWYRGGGRDDQDGHPPA